MCPSTPPGTSMRRCRPSGSSRWATGLENMNGGGVGLGRLDQYLYPLYKAGLEDGTLTEERAMEILECMFIKVGEVVPYQGKSTAGGHEGYTHFEALSLGGLTPDGRDATNPLTYLILRSKKEFPFQYPDVSLRVHANTPDKLLRAAAEVVKVGYRLPQVLQRRGVLPPTTSRRRAAAHCPRLCRLWLLRGAACPTMRLTWPRCAT